MARAIEAKPTTECIPEPKDYDAEAIRRIRKMVGVSQSVFAQILGVTTDAVQSWEQGVRDASGPACRLFELIELDASVWVDMLWTRRKR